MAAQWGCVGPLFVCCGFDVQDQWVKQNAMKVVSTMAVKPQARDALRTAGVVEVMEKIASEDDSATTAEIATTAIDAVLWEP